MKLFINLTPCIPLSNLGEGEDIKKEGRQPLLNTPKIGESKRGRTSIGRVGWEEREMLKRGEAGRKTTKNWGGGEVKKRGPHPLSKNLSLDN